MLKDGGSLFLNVVLIEGWAWLPWTVIFPATVLLWHQRTRVLGLWAIGVGYALASLVGQISAPVGSRWQRCCSRAGRSQMAEPAGSVSLAMCCLS